MVRRKAQDPEPERLLEEALGGPWSGWEVAAPFAIIKHSPVTIAGGRTGEEYRVTKSDKRHRKGVKRAPGIRYWRSNASVMELNGHMTVDAASSTLLKSDFLVVFSAQRTGETVHPRRWSARSTCKPRSTRSAPCRRFSDLPPRSCRCASASFPSSASYWAG
jgi:hypothetical protein